jgi:hypothetical protein
MNAAQLAQRLLVYTDQRTLSEANTAGVEYIQSAVDAINSAAQELYRLAPAIAERRYGLATRAPATLTIDAVTGSATATILSGWESWMVGQALRSPMPVNRIFAGTPSAPTGNIIVSGAGSDAFNGTYAQNGSLSGKPKYSKVGDSDRDILWSGTEWVIRDPDDFWYVSTDNVATPDLVTTWTIDGLAELPAPTVTAEMSASSLTLQNQFPFTQNALAATIYNDAIPLPAEIVKILPDVIVDDSVFLQPANTEAQLNSIITLRQTNDYGRPYPFRRRAIPSEPGVPAAYMVDTIGSSATGAAPQRYLRLSPWPVAAHSVSFMAKVKPIPVTVASIDAANNGAACTTEVPVPIGWDETYLLPIALQHFTGSPFWNNQGAAQEIARRYQQAITDLPMSHPQSHRPTAIYPAV